MPPEPTPPDIWPPPDPRAQAVVDFATDFEKRQGVSRMGILAAITLMAMSGYVLWRIFDGAKPGEVKAAFFSVGSMEILWALVCVAASYFVLTGYDALALRALHARVDWRTTMLGSFTSYAVSFSLGFPMLTGGAVRYWIYKPKGVSTGNIARLTIISGITFWLGMAAIVGLGLAVQAEVLSALSPSWFPLAIDRLLGLGILAVIALYVVWVGVARPSVTIQRWRLVLPGPTVTLGQMALGAADICAAAGVLYLLLPSGLGLSFLSFAAIYAFACMVGIASHAPGGLGVFEAAMLLALPMLPRESVLGALLIFRLIYYVLPFVLALALLGGREALTRIRATRNKMDEV